MLVVEDIQPASGLSPHVCETAASATSERQERLQEGNARRRLPRSPGPVNDFSLAKPTLGQARSEAEAAFPREQGYRVKEVPGGLSFLDLHAPPAGQPYWATQVLVRLDDASRVSEIRVRYREGLADGEKGKSLLDRLSDAKAGLPEYCRRPGRGYGRTCRRA